MYLLSLVTATLLIQEVCPLKTASCVFCKRFQTLTVISFDPEIIYFISLVIVTVFTHPVCPCKTVSCELNELHFSLNRNFFIYQFNEICLKTYYYKFVSKFLLEFS